MNKTRIAVVGAGINGLVAANYLRRAGCEVTVIERAGRAGGACVSATAEIGGARQDYALGASVLGLMQDFVFEETGLAARLQTFVPEHPKLIHFPGGGEPTWIYRDPSQLDRELARKWGERGQVEAFREDEGKVVDFLVQGYREARPPTLDDARQALGPVLAELWISGSARDLMDHYFTSERSKIYMAMTVTESGPVSLHDPYTAFTLPMMDSGTIFGGYYGFVKGGIWQITEALQRINTELGVVNLLDARVVEVDHGAGRLHYEQAGMEVALSFDHLVFATDPMTAARLNGDTALLETTSALKYRGSSGKLNLMFRKPVQWKHGSSAADSDAAFRFIFAVETIDEFERVTTRVRDDSIPYEPGYMQIYCEGAAMRQLGHRESFDRLAVFFKNLSLGDAGESLPQVEQEVRNTVLGYVHNPDDCVWSRLLTPRDLKNLFLFPGGNIDHTVLVGGQTYFDRTFSNQPETAFYRLGAHENIHICGSGTYPCGSVTGTPGYMCSQQLLRSLA